MNGRLFYIQYNPYIVAMGKNGKPFTRRANNVDKEARTCDIRYKNEVIKVDWHY